MEPKTNSRFNFPKKPLIILLVALIIGVGGYYLLTPLAHYVPALRQAGVTPKIQPKLVKQTTLTEVKLVKHPELFYADIEYNLSNNSITLQKTGRIEADVPPLSPTAISQDSAYFIYRIEVVSDKNDLLYNGWVEIPLEILFIKENKFNIRLLAPYKPPAIMRMYNIHNKVILTTKIS